MFVTPKNEKKNIPADTGYFLSTEIDPTDFKKENLTRKIRRKKAEKTISFSKKIFQKILQQAKQSKKISKKYILKIKLDKEINQIK